VDPSNRIALPTDAQRQVPEDEEHEERSEHDLVEDEKELHHSRSEQALGRLLREANEQLGDRSPPIEDDNGEESSPFNKQEMLNVSWKRSNNQDNEIRIQENYFEDDIFIDDEQ